MKSMFLIYLPRKVKNWTRNVGESIKGDQHLSLNPTRAVLQIYGSKSAEGGGGFHSHSTESGDQTNPDQSRTKHHINWAGLHQPSPLISSFPASIQIANLNLRNISWCTGSSLPNPCARSSSIHSLKVNLQVCKSMSFNHRKVESHV